MKTLLFSSLLFLFACSGDNGAIKIEGMPSWYIAPDKTNNFDVYGTGASLSKDESTNIALTNAIGKVRTNVSSFVRNQASIVNGVIAEEMQTKITNEVEKFSLSGYENTKLEYDKKTKIFYSEVKISKTKIYNEKLAEYENEINETESSFINSQKGNLLTKLNFAKKLSQKSEILKKDATILYALNNSFGYKAELVKISKYSQYRESLLLKIRFSTGEVSDNSAKNSITSALTQKKLQVGKGENENTIYVHFKKEGETATGKVYGRFFAKTQSVISLKTITGGVLSEKTITFGSTSTISEAEAYKESLKDLSTKVSEMIEEIIG